MHVAILDTNVLRGISPDDFALLTAAESSLGIRQYADLWTIMELVAHLTDCGDSQYWRSRRALQRCATRALLQPRDEPRLVDPMEVQMSRLAFGEVSEEERTNVVAHIELAQMIATAPDEDDLSTMAERIRAISAHVAAKENWFAEYFANLRQEVRDVPGDKTLNERHALVRAHMNSEMARREDAIALVARTFRQRGRDAPDPIPPSLIEKVELSSRTSSHAVAVLLERIVCDGANLDKPKIRNLLWDQEIAGNAGQEIDGLPILVVTRDKFFAEAARRAGHPAAVCDPSQYARMLGISLTSTEQQ